MSYKVLYVEDELSLANIVKETMESRGFTVAHLQDGIKAIETIATFGPDVCLLDVMLPFIDGFSLGNRIRATYPALPIIFLTAKDSTKDIVEGFASGGTDYLKKPFSMEELMVRINNQITLQNRHGPKAENVIQNTVHTLGDFEFHPTRLELRHKEKIIKLSSRETEILNVLCVMPNETIDRRRLMQVVWGDDSYFISRNLDVYIRKLRSYFALGSGVEIITLKGKGYLFSVAAAV